MVNICEPLINFVKAKQAKVADRLEPKGVQLVTPLHVWGYTDIRLPEKRRNLTYQSLHPNHFVASSFDFNLTV